MGHEREHHLSFSRIFLKEEGEVAYWTHELGVDELSLRIAIATVGRNEARVRDYLPRLASSDE